MRGTAGGESALPCHLPVSSSACRARANQLLEQGVPLATSDIRVDEAGHHEP